MAIRLLEVSDIVTTQRITLLGHHIGAMDATRISGTSEEPHHARDVVEACICHAHDADVVVVVQ